MRAALSIRTDGRAYLLKKTSPMDAIDGGWAATHRPLSAIST
jgi:hypothetical protein